MRSATISLVLAASASICLGAIVQPQLPIPINGLESLQQPAISKSHYSNDLIGLHKNLTTIESISLNELKVGQWLKSFLEEQGYSTEAQEVEKERYNILAWPGKKRNAKTLITSHIDTVPPFYDYKVRKDGKKTMISGRGSVDAKAAVAAQIIATNQLLSSGKIHADDVALLYVVGEEIHGDGMRAANALGLTPDTVIFGEPTEGKLASGHKGMLGFKIRALGKAAHSGYPWLGRSANEVLIKALAALMELGQNLPKSDKYGVTTINIGKMTGGVAANVVAETAEAQIAVRIAEGTPADIKKACLDAVNAAVSDYTDGGEEVIEIEFTSAGYGPVSIDHDVPGFDTIVVNYGTDIPNFSVTDKSQKRYLYGPGSILVAHSNHEIISLDDLERAVVDYKTLILHSLKK